mmetsp:Transcript_61906/g.164596  ORF Transcript_61906/g.164596 Transcript_61906/m.164596 type:complete len:254 (-) Transcript_61906:20-781(-)
MSARSVSTGGSCTSAGRRIRTYSEGSRMSKHSLVKAHTCGSSCTLPFMAWLVVEGRLDAGAQVEEMETPGSHVSVEPAGYANSVGLTSCSTRISARDNLCDAVSTCSPAMQTVSELPPPAMTKHMPTSRRSSISADRFSVVAPASMTGSYAMTIEVFEVEMTPSKSVKVEPAGYPNCVGLVSCTGARPAMQTVSELPPPAMTKHMPTSRRSSISADRFSVVAPASMTGSYAMTIEVFEVEMTPSKSVKVEPAG